MYNALNSTAILQALYLEERSFMVTYNIGPFSYESVKHCLVNGRVSRVWRMSYCGRLVAEKTLSSADGVIAEVHAAFEEARSKFISAARTEHGPARIDLVEFGSDELVASFESYDSCGMTPGLINDSSRYWIRSHDRKFSLNVSIYEFARIVSAHEAPSFGWIAGLLPDDVLSTDPSTWRAPTSWELRHVVGEGSFTGVSGARAADLVGVTPQNFRKYTARDDASTRQKISFAMWHLLLCKLGVQAV